MHEGKGRRPRQLGHGECWILDCRPYPFGRKAIGRQTVGQQVSRQDGDHQTFGCHTLRETFGCQTWSSTLLAHNSLGLHIWHLHPLPNRWPRKLWSLNRLQPNPLRTLWQWRPDYPTTRPSAIPSIRPWNHRSAPRSEGKPLARGQRRANGFGGAQK